MGYNIEQIIENYNNYEEVCNIFFEIAPNEKIREKLKDILYNGKSNDFVLYSGTCNKDNPRIEGQRRISMAYLLIRNPETYEEIEKNKINLFHGTNSNALSNILKYGLNSVNELNKNNIEITTGEKWSRINGERDFVSFTDVLDISENYCLLDQLKENVNFPVLIGTTSEEVSLLKKSIIHSDIPEVGIKNKLPQENIRVIGVPSDKVEYVSKLLNNDKIIVISVDDIGDKFYYIEDYGNIYIDEEKLKQLKYKLNSKEKKFSNNEIKHLTMLLKLKNVKKILEKIKLIYNKGEKNDDRPRYR